MNNSYKINSSYKIKLNNYFILLIFFISSFGSIFSQVSSDEVEENELKYFSAQTSGDDIKIKWASLNELNNDFYVLEKSLDGNSFKVIAIEEVDYSQNKSFTYSLVDNQVSNLVNFYRLKQISIDGEIEVLDEIKFDYRFSVITNEIVLRKDVYGNEVNGNYRGIVIVSYSDGRVVQEIQ